MPQRISIRYHIAICDASSVAKKKDRYICVSKFSFSFLTEGCACKFFHLKNWLGNCYTRLTNCYTILSLYIAACANQTVIKN